MHRVYPVEVKKDQGNHSDMSSKEMEEYRELLRQLELTSKEESDDSSMDTS